MARDKHYDIAKNLDWEILDVGNKSKFSNRIFLYNQPGFSKEWPGFLFDNDPNMGW
jgi:hypothetical protein